MKIKHLLPLTRLVGKVENDFNIDNADWITRVAAWTSDALAQLKCLPYCWKKKKCTVTERIAHCDGILDANNVRVYTKQGCLIKKASVYNVDVDARQILDASPIGINEHNNWSEEEIDFFEDDEVAERLRNGRICRDYSKNFVIIDDDKIELNFDTDWIIVEYYGVATYFDEYFNDDVPYVYDNGDLLEALSWYILFKMLSRGYKHQVFSLTDRGELNPYVVWNKLRPKAAASVRVDLRDPDRNEGWNNFFYNSTFLPRQ